MEIKFEELEKLCLPIVETLKKSNPHVSVIITSDSIKVEETQIFIPLHENDD